MKRAAEEFSKLFQKGDAKIRYNKEECLLYSVLPLEEKTLVSWNLETLL